MKITHTRKGQMAVGKVVFEKVRESIYPRLP